jgi:DNA polymerase III subunit beta
MNITVLQSDLSKALSTAIRFTSSRSSLPVLNNFLLIARKSKLIIKATNLEISISLSVGAKIEEEGEITVPAKLLLDIITNLNSGQLTITLDKEELKVVSGSFKAKLPTIPSNDFPIIPESLDSKLSFTLPGNILTTSLNKILFSASSDETRPILTGVLFVFDQGTNSSTLSLVASDGFRLSRKVINLTKKLNAMQLVIPKSSCLEIIKLARVDEDLEFEVRQGDNQLIVKAGEVIISSRLLEGNFPDFEKIIPKSSSVTVKVDKKDLDRGVRLAAVFARVEGNIVKVKVNDSSMELTSENPKSGNQVNEIEASVVGGAVEISFNYKFIEEFLNVSLSDEVEIKLVDGISPAIFIDSRDPDFLHLIMPVRIQN